MTPTNESLRLLLRQEKLDREYKESVERASRCSPRSKPKSESIFDNTARDIPVTLYLDAKDYERGIHKFEAPVLAINHLAIASFGYHLLTKALPLWLFIMLYW